jgi:hypothetical protein
MCKQGCCCSPELSLMSRLLEFAIVRRMNFGLSANEHVVWRHIANGTVQACGVVVNVNRQ